MRSMKQLYGGVKGYDFEEEYGIILRTIEHEKEKLNNHPRYNDVFRGLNLVSIQKRTLTVMILPVCSQLARLAIISTYSTCMLSSRLLSLVQSMANNYTSSRWLVWLIRSSAA
jgi:SP family general alpha glucoside:H+ symporter-like MFS transporter